MVGGAPARENSVRLLGRYALHGEIAVGGMATVHFGRLHGAVGFSRTVAIKRLHKQYARDPEFVSMFLDEARLAARIRHPNVVPTLDVVATEGELFVVMEYVHGESLARLTRDEARQGRRIPPAVVAGILSGTLQGLHAAHEARDERGEPLSIVHRDVSPQNILVGSDGVARVLDFGVAKAAGRIHTTREGQIKGKLPYMAPEQLSANTSISRLVDVYAASVCLWEALTGQRLFVGESEAIVLGQVLLGVVEPPSRFAPGISPELDQVVLRGLSRNVHERFATAREMALALERAAGRVASTAEIADWIEQVAGAALGARHRTVAEIETLGESTSPEQMRDEISSMRKAVLPAPQMIPPAPSVPNASQVNRSLSESSAQSQLSAVSGAAWTTQRKRPSVLLVVLSVLAACAVMAILIGVGVVIARRSAQSAAAAAPSPSIVALPPPIASPPAAPAPPKEVPPAPSTPATASASAEEASAKPAPPAPPTAVVHKPRPPKPPACPPVTIGPNGEKIFHAECM